ncbi:MAG: 4Fe-4S dicluster domain-containing protein, partial [Candidatus Adiutrix sp.]|nr:4Fe-4S dicluster domain-containing protein [Candidatus Adiutrix sp.]
RGVAVSTAKWTAEHCIQCNQCAFVCPHAVIRPRLLSEAEKAAAPEGFATLAVKDQPGQFFHLAVSSLDCTGCGLCVDTCPAKVKALGMELLSEQMPGCAERWEYAEKKIAYEPLPAGSKITVKTSQFLQPLHEFSGACAGCGETPYAKLLSQLFGDRMMLSNAAGCSTVWTAGSPSVSYTKNKNGHGPAWGFSLFEDCAEYGFGMALGVNQIRNRLALMASEAVNSDVPADAAQALRTWLEGKDSGAGSRERAAALEAALEKHQGGNALMRRIHALGDYFVKRSQWILGGDGWAYDIGYGGLDHVLAQNEDVNVLVFDTEVYSNTGGQASKATPLGAIAQFASAGKASSKKDLGLMAMSYRSIYVAQVALAADKAQTLKAFMEAEAYPGPSIIIAYAPCINHGIRGGLTNSAAQVKEAVEVGYWPLFRYNPLLSAGGGNPFRLDSKAPQGDFAAHLANEVRYSALRKQFPERADALFASAEKAALDRYAVYANLANTVK